MFSLCRARRFRFVGVALAATVSLFAVGCSEAAGPTEVPAIGEGGSRAKEFHSIEQLAGDAAAVVIVGAADKVEHQNIAGASFPVTISTVSRVVAGEVPDNMPLTIHSFVTKASNGKLLLTEPGNYLLFLTPFYMNIGQETGEWVITGGPAGLYVQLNDGLYHKVDKESGDLPEVIDVANLRLPELKPASYFVTTGADLNQ